MEEEHRGRDRGSTNKKKKPSAQGVILQSNPHTFQREGEKLQLQGCWC